MEGGRRPYTPRPSNKKASNKKLDSQISYFNRISKDLIRKSNENSLLRNKKSRLSLERSSFLLDREGCNDNPPTHRGCACQGDIPNLRTPRCKLPLHQSTKPHQPTNPTHPPIHSTNPPAHQSTSPPAHSAQRFRKPRSLGSFGSLGS